MAESAASTVNVSTPARGPRRPLIDIALTFARQFLAGLMQAGLIVVVARLLGADGAGAYAVALLLPTLLAQLLNLGFSNSSVYFVASGRASLGDAWAATRDVMILVALLGTVAGFALVVWSGERVFPGVPSAALMVALLVFPCSLFVTVASSFFQALRQFRAFNVLALVQPSCALLGVGLLWMFGWVDLQRVLVVSVVAHGIAMLIGLSLLSRHVPLHARAVGRAAYLRPALVYGAKAHASNILTFLNYRLDLFLVNLLVGPAAAGLYTVAVRIGEQLWLLSYAASVVAYPHLTAMRPDDPARSRFSTTVARAVLWLTLLGSGALVAIAEPLVDVVFGAEFHGAILALFVSLPGIVVLACSRILASDLAARGWVGVNLALAGLVLVVNTAANLLLIPRYGIAGAAAATSLAYIVDWLIRLVLHRRLIGGNWWAVVVPHLGDARRLWLVLRGRAA